MLLSIEGHGENLERAIRSSSRQREADKILWQVGKSYKDLRDEGEAPPRNVVKDRLKNFEIGNDKNQPSPSSNATPTPLQWDDNEKFKWRNYEEQVCSSEEEQEQELENSANKYKKLEHKRSVKDLLSDFEKKSKALQEEEKEQRGIGSFLLKDTRDGGQRRVCSDTETMHFATSSDEDDKDDEFSTARSTSKLNSSKPEREESFPPPPLPNDFPPKPDGETITEETYLAMTPAKASSTPLRLNKSSLVSPHTSRTSLTSSQGSLQSLTSHSQQQQQQQQQGPPTPSQLSGAHNRTPSQTLVMEHFRPDLPISQLIEEETYVDMNEDGTQVTTPRMRIKEPILAKQCREKDSNLDSTLTYEPPESPRYCEIDERTELAHYELLSNAVSAPPQHYSEVVYQEIAENIPGGPGVATSSPARKSQAPPLRPIEGLPDILGNAPTNKGNSSSDADDESSKDFDAIETKNRQSITLDDSFRPASFYLSRCKTSSNDCDDDSSDSDLVSPPPVPSSPPPMEEVLGFTSPSNFDSSNYAEELNNVLSAPRSSSALRERSRRDSSVGSEQSLNRDLTRSPQKLHGSAASLSSRELPPVPGSQAGNLQGSQQSLASKEIQQIGSRSSQENIFRNSPYHSREGSLDNEAFLFHKFTQGTSISDYYKRQGSDSAELSSSDTANYEQEYRRYHLENIQEVSNTLERSEAHPHHNTSIISQELNISYNSVYEARLGPGKGQKSEEENPPESGGERGEEVGSARSKIPYYMSDIMADGTVVSRAPLPDNEAQTLGVVDAITKSMNALDVESKSYFEEKNQRENERIKLLRRSYTPDPYLAKAPVPDPIEPGVVGETQSQTNNVTRSKSLEGLLGDSQGGPKDNIGYAKQTTVQQDQPPPSQGPRPPSSNSRRGPPPPPPAGIPPLDLSLGDDEVWADSLRRASLQQQRAKSSDSLPPPTAPKPKTPVPSGPAVAQHHQGLESYNSFSPDQTADMSQFRNNDRRHPAQMSQNRNNDMRSPPQNHHIDMRSPPQNHHIDMRSPPQNHHIDMRSPPHAIQNHHIDMRMRSPVHMAQNISNNMGHPSHMSKAMRSPHHVEELRMISREGQQIKDTRYHAGDIRHYYRDMGNYSAGDMRQNNPNMSYPPQFQSVPPQFQSVPPQHQQVPPQFQNISGNSGYNQPSNYAGWMGGMGGPPRQVTGYMKSAGEVNQSSERQDVLPAGPDRNHRDPRAHYSQPSQHPAVIQRNTVVKRNDNFLDSSLPSPTCEPTQRRSVSRPSSRGPDMGGQQSRDSLAGKCMTLPARIRYSQDSDSDNSPRSRTSKSGLHEDSCPVPPSPSPAQHNMIDSSLSNHSNSPQKDDWSHQNSRGNIHNMSFSPQTSHFAFCSDLR